VSLLPRHDALYTHQAQEENAKSHEPQRPGKTPECNQFLHQLGRFSTCRTSGYLGPTRDQTAPPKPAPQDAMPVDSPRFFMKNWLGMVYAV
jgi:hypothetical protein